MTLDYPHNKTTLDRITHISAALLCFPLWGLVRVIGRFDRLRG